jgi:hypothetical protein
LQRHVTAKDQREGSMNNNKMIWGLLAFIIMAAFAAPAFSADPPPPTTIFGRITAEKQLVAEDGQIYGVIASEMGQNLLQNIDRTVEVKGMVQDAGEMKKIDVEAFHVVK